MAIILKNKKYLKIDENGNYIIYKDEASRALEKKSTTYENVINTYNIIIDKLSGDVEQRYYDPNFFKILAAWDAEFSRYVYNYQHGKTGEKYPLIKKYIKDIDNTIPKIIARGRLGIETTTAEEMYKKIKDAKYFGTEEEIGDA